MRTSVVAIVVLFRDIIPPQPSHDEICFAGSIFWMIFAVEEPMLMGGRSGQQSESSELRHCARSEVIAIDKPIAPKVNVQESVANAKVYCKQNPESFVSLRDYSGGIYNQTCADFAAEQQATDPAYKIGKD
jgi:hypothetical protein